MLEAWPYEITIPPRPSCGYLLYIFLILKKRVVIPESLVEREHSSWINYEVSIPLSKGFVGTKRE
jgi:hypothetical protein